MPGVASALRTLYAAGYPAIVCTNQSGIARGMIGLSQYRAVRERLDALLAAEGASLLDTFTCPHHPDFGLPCDCRKPGTALFERAAAMHGLALSHCLFIGDRARDVLPATRYGAAGALVGATNDSPGDADVVTAAGFFVATSLADAVALLVPSAR